MNEITFRQQSRVALIYEDFLDICEGNSCAAMVLSQMYHLHGVQILAKQNAVVYPFATDCDLPEMDEDDGVWVRMAHGRMQEEMLATFGEKAISPAFTFLVSKGYLNSRANPHDKRDRKREYMFCAEKVQAAIDALPPSSDLSGARRIAARCQPQAGYVYLLRSSHGLYKIGKSLTPLDRVRSLGVVLPFPIETDCLIECDDYTGAEVLLHKMMERYRVNSEWFDLPQDRVDWILSVDKFRDGVFLVKDASPEIGLLNS